MNPLLRRLRRLTGPDEPDAHLLARHAAGDPAAVEELVRRHGPLVWAAARRRLPDPADAADVFQATFLLLLQRAAGFGSAVCVGPWLYRVAALTARNLRRKNARRLARRRPLFDHAGAADPHLSADLDDALLLLGERDRAAVVLCHLQGHTRREAAELLGLPEGTLSSVLSRALAKLRTRLGDPLPLLAVGTFAVPAGLATAAGPGAVSLSREVFRMFWLKKLVAGGLAAAACVGMGVGVGLAPRPAAVAADPPAKTPATDPTPSTDEVDRLRKELAELQRQEITARNRASVQAAALREAEQRLAAKRGAIIRLKVSAEERPWDAYIRLEETDAAGTVVADFGCGGGKLGTASLVTHLRRARLDPAGPREVVLEVHDQFPLADLLVVGQAVVSAGFPTVTYTGPRVVRDTTQVRLDKLQPLVKAGEVKGERVELAKVLPVTPAPTPQPFVWVDLTDADSRYGRQAVRVNSDTTVADVVGPAAAGRPVVAVFIARRSPDGSQRTSGPVAGNVLPVDWTGITQRGETATNFQLQPGDHIILRVGK